MLFPKALLIPALLACAFALAACAPEGPEADTPQALFASAETLRTGSQPGRALPLYHRAAESGHPKAQLRLGDYYYFGSLHTSDSLRQRPSTADRVLRWITGSSRTARQRDTAAAARWYRRAEASLAEASLQDTATMGNISQKDRAEAYYHLGLLRSIGQGIKQDRAAARRHLQEAVRLGHPPAYFWLGMMYERNDQKARARTLYREAIDAGLFQGYLGLARLHLGGLSADSLSRSGVAAYVRTLRKAQHSGLADADDAITDFVSGLRRGAGNGSSDAKRYLRHLHAEGLLPDTSAATPAAP